MNLKGTDITNIPEVAVHILAGAVFAADFCAVRDLVNPKSKLRHALERQAPGPIRRELPRVLLDPEALGEADRVEYDRIRQSVEEGYGEQIQASPFDPPQSLVEELAERAIARGSYASASAALEHIGTLNKRVGELVASGLRNLKTSSATSGVSGESGSVSPLRSAAEALWLALKLKDPLEPLFQKRAIDFHFSAPEMKEKFFKALVTGSAREALDVCTNYLLGDREISGSVRGALPAAATRKAFLLELARVLSGGDEKYAGFVSRYSASVAVLRAGSDKADPAAVQRALHGDEDESHEGDGIGLLRSLAVAHPVSALICRMIMVPRQGPYLIPTVFEGNSALDVLGLRP